jgi:very-short-patch-repair endonuclease
MSMILTAEIMRIAELRDGLVTRYQLQKHGLTERQISRLVVARVLQPVFRNVYALDPPPWPLHRRAHAACLAADVVVSDMTAAAHWRLRRTPRDVLEVVLEAPNYTRLPGVTVHRTNVLHPDDVVGYGNGMRVTSPARTLFDIAADLDPSTMRSVVDDALNRRLCSAWSLGAVAERMLGQGRPGTTVFRAVLDDHALEVPPVGSDAELLLAQAWQAAGLPVLCRQHEVALDGHGIVRLDLSVPQDRFAIEVDDPMWHADPIALQRDHARDLLLGLEGWSVRRVTTEDVYQRLRSTLGLLARLYNAQISRRLRA